MGGGKKKKTIGYKYYFSMHMGICRGAIDELVEITVGDRIAWTGSAEYNTSHVEILIDQPNLFGGLKREGGIQGPLQIYFGSQTQPAPEYLSYIHDYGPSGAPNWPGVCHTFFGGEDWYDAGPLFGTLDAYFSGYVCANNPYPKPWAFRVRRVLQGWDGSVFRPDLAVIWLTGASTAGHNTSIKAMNPAHIIWEALTNRIWGRGLATSMLDEASFVSAAITLYNEGFGLCIRWSKEDEIQSFVQGILDHIAGSLFVKRSTGLLTLRLMRGGYDPNAIPLYDTANGLLEIVEMSAVGASSTTNEVIVKYLDTVNNMQGSVRVSNIASLQQSGGAFNTMTTEYPGIPTPELAYRAAQRDLRAMSDGLRRFTLKMDRRVWDLEPGGLIRIQDVSRGIPPTVLRVGKVEDGTLTNGVMTVSAAQDTFSMPSTSFISPQPPVWEPPVTIPCSGRQTVVEMPYFLLAGTLGASELASLTEDSAFIGTLVERGSGINVGYDIAVRTGLPEVEDWPPTDDTFCGYVRPEGAPGGG